MTGGDQKVMALLSSQGKILHNQRYSKLMMAYSFLEGNSEITIKYDSTRSREGGRLTNLHNTGSLFQAHSEVNSAAN